MDILEQEVEQKQEEQIDDSLKVTSPEPNPEDFEGKGGVPQAKHEPSVNSPRWNEVYRGWKESDRKVASLETKIAERDKDIDALRQHNQRMTAAFEEFKKSSEVKPQEKDTFHETYQTNLQSLRQKRNEARSAGDYKTADTLQDQIDELRDTYTKTQVTTSKVTSSSKASEEDINRTQAIADWTAKTPWYNSKSPKHDPIMAAAARGLSNDLELSPDWKDRSPQDKLKEIATQIEKRFNWKEAPTTKLPSVGEVDTTGESITPTQVKLTAEERRVAKLLFPDDEQAEITYAAQVKQFARRK